MDSINFVIDFYTKIQKKIMLGGLGPPKPSVFMGGLAPTIPPGVVEFNRSSQLVNVSESGSQKSPKSPVHC